MPQRRYEFREPTTLTTGARGKPGQRTFYLLVSDSREIVRVWVEKEHLQAMSLAITQLLYTLPERAHDQEAEQLARPSINEPDAEATVELRAGKMALAYDRERDRVGVLIYEVESDRDDEPAVVTWVSREQLKLFAERIDEVVAAGRPICPLCGGPIDETGHVCPKKNGHIARSV